MNCPHSLPAPRSLPPPFLPLKQAHPPPAPLKGSRSHSVHLSTYLTGDLSLSPPASPSKAGACVWPFPVPWRLARPACPPRALMPLSCVSSPRWPSDCSSLPALHPARPVPPPAGTLLPREHALSLLSSQHSLLSHFVCLLGSSLPSKT